YEALLLPGGHRAAGMRAYLEDPSLQAIVARFFDDEKPVGAVCHGVVLAARSISARTGKSVLYGRRTTALTWQLEKAGWTMGRLMRFWDPNYYRTYVEAPGQSPGYTGVQAEVTRALASPEDFISVPLDAPDFRRKTDGTHRDTPADPRPAWVVRDGSYVSARWPGDAHLFATTFAQVLARSGVSGAPAAQSAPRIEWSPAKPAPSVRRGLPSAPRRHDSDLLHHQHDRLPR
ncbi:MAG: DJ-1/PfpI family protein, partial [Vulcanimicrobiaceae bacterium]